MVGVFALGVSLVIFNSVYVDLKYNEINITFTAGSVYVCGACIHVVVGLSVRFPW